MKDEIYEHIGPHVTVIDGDTLTPEDVAKSRFDDDRVVNWVDYYARHGVITKAEADALARDIDHPFSPARDDAAGAVSWGSIRDVAPISPERVEHMVDEPWWDGEMSAPTVPAMRTGGADGVAPCGHAGEHIFGNYVKCLAGCDAIPLLNDAVPEPVEREITRPTKNTSGIHAAACASGVHVRYVGLDGQVVCLYCNECLHENSRPGRLPGGWYCNDCGAATI